MSKFFKYFEYAYLIFATVFVISGCIEWGDHTNQAYLLFGMAAVAVFMFFFKRRFRRRFEERNK
jgi:LPXTG-motif cell wall-anchored protein